MITILTKIVKIFNSSIPTLEEFSKRLFNFNKIQLSVFTNICSVYKNVSILMPPHSGKTSIGITYALYKFIYEDKNVYFFNKYGFIFGYVKQIINKLPNSIKEKIEIQILQRKFTYNGRHLYLISDKEFYRGLSFGKDDIMIFDEFEDKYFIKYADMVEKYLVLTSDKVLFTRYSNKFKKERYDFME